MSGFGQNPGTGGKNPPWARPSNNVATNAMNSALGLSIYQQLAQSFQIQAGLQTNQYRYPQYTGHQTNQESTNSTQTTMFNPLSPVRYPTQVTGTYQASGSQASNLTKIPLQPVQANQNSTKTTTTQKTRVFTGVITRKQENFGFIDDDVFFRSTAVQGRDPAVGDTVLVEASFNDSMPFKWNATRVQTINPSRSNTSSRINDGTIYNSTNSSAVSNTAQSEPRYREINARDSRPRDRRSPDRSAVDRRNDDRRGIERDRYSREKDSDHKMRDNRRSRHSVEKEKEKDKEKSNKERERDRDRSRVSPFAAVRNRARASPRYDVQVPKISLVLPEVDVLELRRRYPNMYVPSDFYLGEVRWVDQFPPLSPFVLDHPCNFHIMRKDADPVYKNDAVLEPPDLDYLYSAKVMLMSMPNLEEIYQRCISLAEKKDEDANRRDYNIHPSRLLDFLVGAKGKNETMAIGGPWSPSLDGPDPDKDPSVLIKTAIRTCKALTGIDLSNCTQWYRFVEIHYQRGDTLHKGKHIPARVETVVLFLPDVWSCIPTQLEWEKIRSDYKQFIENSLDPEKSADVDAENADSKSPEPDIKLSSSPKTPDDDKEMDQPLEDDSGSPSEKQEPTLHSQLDPKNMKVQRLKDELEARNLSSKGLKYQLTARLTKALKTEEEEAKKKEDEEKLKEALKDDEKKKETESWTVVDSWSSIDEKSSSHTDKEDKKDKEKLRASLEKRYTLPDSPHIIVYPSREAKAGKFECSLMSLSLLLDYRLIDNKEHLFEISLFAELFNEMLMRDFGFLIYRSLLSAAERLKEEEKKEDEKKTDDKKSESEEPDKKEKENKLDKVKHYTENRKLLLAFSYFDTSGCGYIIDADMEKLLFSLGLHLSRSQVRKLLGKIIKRDSPGLVYRKLTDKPLDDGTGHITVVIDEDDCFDDGISSQLAAGRKRKSSLSSIHNSKFPKADNSADADNKSDFILYKGSLINVESITSQLRRSENARLETENVLTKFKADYSNVEKNLAESNVKIKTLQDESKQLAEELTVVSEKCLSLSNQNQQLTAAVFQVNNIIKPFILPQKRNDVKPNESDDIKDVKDIKVEGVESSNPV